MILLFRGVGKNGHLHLFCGGVVFVDPGANEFMENVVVNIKETAMQLFISRNWIGWIALGVLFVLSASAQEVQSPTKLANGARCAAARPPTADVSRESNLCQSGRCMPGPGNSGANVAWYCTSSGMNCAQPGGDRAVFGATMSTAGVPYTCRDGDGVDVEGPSRFAP
jgi:hypothetical protein